MAPGERLPKAARKDQNCSLPKFCFAIQPRIKIPRTKGNPKMEMPLPKTKGRNSGEPAQESSQVMGTRLRHRPHIVH